ncbi:MAG: lipopolysaccharide heptosyltransferase II, partial [Burkholderiaceae bacterium]
PAPAAPSPGDLPRPTLSVTQAQLDSASVRLGLQPGSRLIAFAPGAEFGPAKRWPANHFAELAKIIRKNYPDVQIVMLGSPKDREVCDEIAAAQPWLLNFAGITTLDEAIAMLAKADVVVSNDSGLMNIASALNRPIVGLYGPTDWKHTPPFSDVAKIVSLNLDCSPCQQRECPLGHHNCMRNLTADIVWKPLQAILSAR